MKDIIDLNVYTELLEFSNKIWTLCKQFNYFDQRTLGIQLVRSVEDTKDRLRKAFVRKLLPKQLGHKTFDEITIISKKLNSYINSIKARSNSKY
ncbi:MAG: hypothetical protein U9P73_03775 [Candidatus Cloacimonadota bacterium]|nr:hypothetical protein [Candidatus Cloacimonadota bacterium]